MDALTFSAVILAAALHAGWNAMIKVRLEPILSMALIAAGCAAIGLPVLLFTGLPVRESWPWLAASIVLHLGYYMTLAGGYARAEMTRIYPIARGGAPLLTTIVGVIVLGEQLLPIQIAAIAMLGSGIMTLSLIGRRSGAGTAPTALLFAGATAVLIAGYTIVDGMGARAAGNPHAFIAALFVLEGVLMFALVGWQRGGAGIVAMRPFLMLGIAGGAMAAAGYWIAVWAMTRAPIPLVGAVRETSVLFALVIGHVFLKEALTWPRAVACCMIVAALALLRLG